MKFEKRDIPKKSEGLSDWYNKVVLEAELADYGPAKGTMIFRPYGFGIWEQIQNVMNEKIQSRGVENAYFPMFIPENLLTKEKKHIDGFSPELAVVTIGGGEELKEKLVVRPTSETIMYDAYSRWIHSWRDLPMQINQWNNVVRWEKRTYLFLRTTEFLWQEGHTAHATHEESTDVVKWAMNMYQDVYKDVLAIPGYMGKKSESEKFAGAEMTLTYETLMPEGKALQSCTSHDLGQNFSKPFDIRFSDKDGENQYVWQTSWGLSTRAIGALLMIHGDDQGLRLPPRVAPIQVVIVPVRENDELMAYGNQMVDALKAAGVRVKFDTRESESLGHKINKWELRGVPIRIEIGPKEMEKGTITLVRRDTFEKESLAVDAVVQNVQERLDQIHAAMYDKASEYLKENTREVSSYSEFQDIMNTSKGFILAPWCEDASCEEAIKQETKATTRCLPDGSEKIEANCIKCEKPASYKWLFAQAY